VAFVHDEIVVEADETQAEQAKEWLRQATLDGLAPLIAPVPVVVEVSLGVTWSG
jgi:DNA polymerase I-like protein with 3'-5' exonuclease and polymerase domains